MIHVLLPTQTLRRAGSREFMPYKRLMAAVLQTVVDDCRGSAYRRARATRFETPVVARGTQKAVAYMASTDRAWPFSFENLCEALGLDAACLRQELKNEPRARSDDSGRISV